MTVAPVLDHRLELVPVDQFSDGPSTVARQLRDFLQRHTGRIHAVMATLGGFVGFDSS
jgi:hypothetical protein